MPIVNGPYQDPEEDESPRRHKAPKALARMRRQFTEEKRLRMFRDAFEREPESDEELEEFAEDYLLELYNAGYDEFVESD